MACHRSCGKTLPDSSSVLTATPIRQGGKEAHSNVLRPLLSLAADERQRSANRKMISSDLRARELLPVQPSWLAKPFSLSEDETVELVSGELPVGYLHSGEAVPAHKG